MNIKKLFPDKKESKRGFLEFLDKKGFYIILILCIAIVGVTAVFVTTNNLKSPDAQYEAQEYIPDEADIGDIAGLDDIADEAEPDLPANPASSVTTGEKDEITEAKSSPEPMPSPAVTSAPKADTTTTPKESTGGSAPKASANEQKSPAPEKAPDKTSSTSTVFAQTEPQSFIMPVPAPEVTFVFAQDKLVYSKTLDDWRTHNGVDLSAERGTNVVAVADGIVTEVKNDPRYGFTVVIDHQNGLKTVYANLASGDVVSPNQKVVQGEIIGSVGNTALFEAAEQPHLHFQVFKDGVLVDPMEYLPDISGYNKN